MQIIINQILIEYLQQYDLPKIQLYILIRIFLNIFLTSNMNFDRQIYINIRIHRFNKLS